MKRNFTILLILLAFEFLKAQPTNNPVSSYYGKGNYPIWTDKIKWSRVINMSTYSNGSNDFQKFENARNELYTLGGGVLYYPAGKYNFKDMPAHGRTGRGLMLKSGVVIRGEKPTDTIAIDGSLNLRTVFQFPVQLKGSDTIPDDWSFIGIVKSGTEQLKDVKNVGIAYVKIRYGAIYWGFQCTWGAKYSSSGAWKSALVKTTWDDRVADGTHPHDAFCGASSGATYEGAGSGRLVFGCLLENSTVINDIIDEGAGANGYYMYKFGSRIGIYASNILVANNSIPISNRNFKYTQKTSSGTNKTILFDYGKTFGLDINKSQLGATTTNNVLGYTKENVIIRDNYVFNHGTKGYELSGNWMLVLNNKNERYYLKESADVYGLGAGWELTLDGYLESEAGGSGSKSDNLSRAFDMSGRNGWIDGNWFNNTGSDPGNDGEGILWQAHGGMTNIESFAITNNTHIQGNGETTYMGGYDVGHLGSLIAWNTLTGWVGNDKAGVHTDAAFVNNTASGGIRTTGTDFISTCPSGSPTAPSNVTASLATDTSYVLISWTDNSNNEVGFRVDRKIGTSGTWETIVIRPRRSNGTSINEQKWRDYMIPRGSDVYYRVVAINCSNNDAGASSTVGPIRIKDFLVNENHTNKNLENTFLSVFPNPSENGNINIEFAVQKTQQIIVSVYNSQGIKLDDIFNEHINANKIETISTDLTKYGDGIYFIRIKGLTIEESKIVIVK